MSNIITVGYITEGTTDRRFLEAIIKKTVEEIAFNCDGQIDVYDPVFLNLSKEDSFVNNVVSAARKAYHNGIFILCIHVDSDNSRDVNAFENKINPAIIAVKEVVDRICKVIVPVVPITMSESWMLADKNLFKSELGTTLSDEDLNINKFPESISDPKTLIENALRISQAHLPKRRFKLTIGELYQPIGQKIDIRSLESLSSFRKFKAAIENAFRTLNYMH